MFCKTCTFHISSAAYELHLSADFCFILCVGGFPNFFPPWTNASSNHCGCADRTSRLPRQRHQQQRLTGSLSGSLSAERHLTNETQIIKTRTLKRTYGQVPPTRGGSSVFSDKVHKKKPLTVWLTSWNTSVVHLLHRCTQNVFCFFFVNVC